MASLTGMFPDPQAWGHTVIPLNPLVTWICPTPLISPMRACPLTANSSTAMSRLASCGTKQWQSRPSEGFAGAARCWQGRWPCTEKPSTCAGPSIVFWPQAPKELQDFTKLLGLAREERMLQHFGIFIDVSANGTPSWCPCSLTFKHAGLWVLKWVNEVTIHCKSDHFCWLW
jgi:hypothetical protein